MNWLRFNNDYYNMALFPHITYAPNATPAPELRLYVDQDYDPTLPGGTTAGLRYVSIVGDSDFNKAKIAAILGWLAVHSDNVNPAK